MSNIDEQEFELSGRGSELTTGVGAPTGGVGLR
jgi:hypothetical protein